MRPCCCGHWHAGSCRCGCSYYEPDDGTDGKRDRFWGQRDDHDNEGYPL